MIHGHGGDIYTYGGLLDFSVNVNPLGPPQEVLDAAKRGVELAEHYPDSRCRELKAALARRKHLPGEFFIPGNGAAELLFSLVLAEKPKRALLPVPSFSEYERALKTVDCQIEVYPLEEENGFRLAEDFTDALSADVDMVFLCNPSNPAGQITGRELLLEIAAECEEKKIRLVVDECFVEFLEEPQAYTMEKMTERYSSLFILQALTKTCSIPGLRLGYGITSDSALLERMEEVRQPWGVSVPAQCAGIAALGGEGSRMERARELIRSERKRMEETLRETGVEVIASSCNFILVKSPYDLFRLLKDRGILIRDCSNYRGLGRGWYRTAVRTEEENKRLLEAVRDIYRQEKENA